MYKPTYTLVSPLEVIYGAKKDGTEQKFRLNLNQYRNTHYIILNKAKIAYKELMKEQINRLPELSNINLHYTVYTKTKREFDLSNVCSVVDKFFCDALVELGKLPDDNIKYLSQISFSFGGIDKDNPRIEVTICQKPNNQ